MTLLEQMRAKWDAAGRGAADERAPLLANWYLGNRHAWWEAMEMMRAAESARPAVTREAVVSAFLLHGPKDCADCGGDCIADKACTCAKQINAIMALIEGGAP